MGDEIFLLKADGGLEEMAEREYESEALLQDLLSSHPALLAGGQIDPTSPRRWLLVAPEIGIPGSEGGGDRWALDHLFLDQDAVPTFVEVKRSSDTRIRREVVGQMLDYAANATQYWPVDRIRAQYESREAESGREPNATLAERFGSDIDVDSYWSEVDDNLRLGRIRLAFVADVIPPELERIVEFLNREMRHAEVVAVEVKQYVGGENVTLVPRVVGVTAEARREKRAGRRDDRTFDQLLAATSDDCREAHRLLLQWAERNGYVIETLPKSRGVLAGGSTVVRLYPGYDAAYFYLYKLNDAGREEEAGAIRETIRELSGREPAPSEPNLKSGELVSNWDAVEKRLLPDLVESIARASDGAEA